MADIVGDRSSERGVMLVYDIFGLYPQTVQGASLLAEKLQCLVIIPDFFGGKAASIDWVAMDTEEKRNNMMAFFGEKANPEENLSTLLNIMTQSEHLYPHVKGWGVLGLCWGGKVYHKSTLFQNSTKFTNAFDSSLLWLPATGVISKFLARLTHRESISSYVLH